MIKHLAIALMATILLCNCDRQPSSQGSADNEQPSGLTTTNTLFVEQARVERFESAAEALSLWRQAAATKPVLLLLSKNSQLQPIPAGIKTRALEMATRAPLAQLKASSLATSVDPVILPNMALSAALDAGFFSEVIWVLPVSQAATVTLDSFLQKLLEMNDITEEEAMTFRGDESSFSGTIRSTPFTVTLKEHLPTIKKPIVVHIDISYLGENYKNEISTPLYKHTYEALKQIRELKLQALAVSVAQSNLSREVSLKTRFLGSLIERLTQDPDLLDKPLSEQAKLRNEALYLGNFFKKEDVLILYRKMLENDPQDASIHYDLYQTLRQFNRIDEALEHLEQAAKIDRGYATEYIELAELAVEKRQLGGVTRMLEKAAAFFPENPFLRISFADILIQSGHNSKAENILEELKALPWSPTYHANVPRYLDEMLTAAREADNRENRAH